MTNIIIDAHRRSKEILGEARRAITLLSSTAHTNDFRILENPSAHLLALISASAAIDRAIALHRQTTWPSDADYDAFGFPEEPE